MRTRRGLSSVVGMVFAIIALTSVVTYVSYSMNTLNQYNQSILSKDQQALSIANEKFQVTGASFVNNGLNITLANTGTVPINVTKIWVQNTTAFGQGTDWTISYSPSNKFAGPGATITNIGQQIPGVIYNTKGYHVKLVTSRGSTQEFNVNSGTTIPVFMQVNAIPTASPGSTIQVLYTVMNNQSNNNILLNIQPKMTALPTGGTASATLVSGPSPSSFPSLMPGQSITFKWMYTVGQNTGDTLSFTGSLTNGPPNAASTTVTLSYPQFASQSQTSLQTQGLICCKTNDNTLVLHQETFDTVNGAYQLYSGQVDNKTGHTINFVNNGTAQKTLFDTEYDNSTAVSIPQGNWVLSMYYKSVPIPSTLGIASQPDMIFLFNQSEQLFDSSTYNNKMATGTGSAAPLFQSSCSRDNSGCYSFTSSSNQYLSVTPNPATTGGGNEIGSNDVTTTGWFNPTTLPTTQAVIYTADSTLLTNYFTVYLLSTGNLQLTFKTASGTTVTCTSSNTVKAGDWEFFAATRTGTDNCALYINGTNVASTSNTNGQARNEGITVNNIYIGGDPTIGRTIYGFNGMIDYIMYWNNYMITSQVESGLSTKNYGPSAHVVNIRADIVNAKTGARLANVFIANNVVLPYVDGVASSTGWEYKNFTETNVFNATGINNQVFVSSTERLALNVTYANEPAYAQDMKWDIDDITIPNNLFTSYLTIPPPSQPFDSFFTYSIAAGLTTSITNQGPNGVWLVSATTRIIFQTITPGVYSAAAVAVGDNGTTGLNIMGSVISGQNSYIQDSYFIPVFGNTLLTFTEPSQVPSTTTKGVGNVIQPGYHYKMFINLSGYDDQGNSVFRTIYIGLVRVTA